MPPTFSPTTIFNHLLLAVAKKKIILNYHKFCPHRLGHALLYYKTDSLTPLYRHEYLHTNNWEVAAQVKVLNQLGFWVDVIDRTVPDEWLPTDKYQLFIGLGIDGSGRHYSRLAEHTPSAIKVLYAASANPDQRNQSLRQRYDQFEKRNGQTLPSFRAIDNIDVVKTAQLTNHIISVGNSFTNATFASFHRPIHKIFLSTSPRLQLDRAALLNKQSTNFLFFAGGGNILKGLDLLIETFAQLPHLNLYVCTDIETEFARHYKALINSSPNIHIENFVRVNSRNFNYLTRICGYVILPSSTEGCATSVTTCMRRGLVPVVTPQCGIDVDDCGFYIKDITIPGLTALVSALSTKSTASLRDHIKASYRSSSQYTQSSFSVSFNQAVLNIIQYSKSPST